MLIGDIGTSFERAEVERKHRVNTKLFDSSPQFSVAIEQIKKTLEGEKRSEMVKMAKSNVPEINPN